MHSFRLNCVFHNRRIYDTFFQAVSCEWRSSNDRWISQIYGVFVLFADNLLIWGPEDADVSCTEKVKNLCYLFPQLSAAAMSFCCLRFTIHNHHRHLFHHHSLRRRATEEVFSIPKPDITNQCSCSPSPGKRKERAGGNWVLSLKQSLTQQMLWSCGKGFTFASPCWVGCFHSSYYSRM